jgi:hypothetical protein
MPAARHVVVDGSNIATEGNSLPSLKQLDEAVREFLRENPDDLVTVVVDATFGHRIPPEEIELFEQAEAEGDIVSPPAGAIGRGDAFLLRVADRVGAVVLSNDSFQEFHGEYGWLFDKGRLIGGKPVPGVGWIFTPRSPVRGPKSRQSMKEAQRKRDAETGGADRSGLELAAERSRGKAGEKKVQRAIAVAAEEAEVSEKDPRKRRRRRRGSEPPSEPLNDPLTFINFIAAHRLGAEVEGVIEEFSSHGAFISANGARCYVPLSAMGDPPPRSAREVLRKGEQRTFVVQALDAMRRGIELALPGCAHPSGAPTPETVDAEIHISEELHAEELSTPARGPAGRVPALQGLHRGRPRPDGTRRRRGQEAPVAPSTGREDVAEIVALTEGVLQARAPRRAKAAPAKAAVHAPTPEHIKEASAPKVVTRVRTRAKSAAPPSAAGITGTASTKAGDGRKAAAGKVVTKQVAANEAATQVVGAIGRVGTKKAIAKNVAEVTGPKTTKATGSSRVTATKAVATKPTVATKATRTTKSGATKSATKAVGTKATATKVAATRDASATKATATKATATKATATKATATKAVGMRVAAASKATATKATAAKVAATTTTTKAATTKAAGKDSAAKKASRPAETPTAPPRAAIKGTANEVSRARARKMAAPIAGNRRAAKGAPNAAASSRTRSAASARVRHVDGTPAQATTSRRARAGSELN